ncbi:MAG: acylphosphatase [Nitrospirae bacterium]|nr:acylphosphatase [Nitrospirota bacterium]
MGLVMSDPASNLTRVHLFISGQVQGVGFRAKAQRQAETLGVNGWVANLPDGRVEAVIEGEPALVDQLVDWCRSGPARATVTDVTIAQEPAAGESSFSIRYV